LASKKAQIVVAGHICLDIIPAINALEGGLDSLLAPGKLVEVGAAVVATGGAVSNTGLALHRLGLAVRLMGKVGADPFGRIVLDILKSHGAGLADGMIRGEQAATSYTVVISPPGVDRIFLHCPGANDAFRSADVDYAVVARSGLFHFGYPPLMRAMYADGGRELADMFGRVRQLGVTTSLDLALPDPGSPAGRADWPKILARTLPSVGIFLPSIEEILFMLDRPRFERLRAAGGLQAGADAAVPAAVSQRLLEMGAAVVVLKLGEAGLYLRTARDQSPLAAMGAMAPKDAVAWAARELYSPCFEVRAVGTTGAGDCAIAGFLAAFVKGLGPEDALTAGVAAGACNVEAADATSGVQPWAEMMRRIKSGWRRRPPAAAMSDWRKCADSGVFAGPNDAAAD
jgi:sugar/nucleoside kinase (ribokinase family)